MSKQKFSGKAALWLIVALLVVVGAAVVAWGGSQIFPLQIPFEAPWASSGHADGAAEAFAHWDLDVPPEIPTRCAKCHSGLGYLDFLGVDGTEAGKVDNAAPIGTTVDCITCHNEATAIMDSVVFPSGVEVTGLGASARCMQCHQGRKSAFSVDDAITADPNVVDDDTVGKMSFQNMHYAAAAATQLGGMTMGGYQYAGKSYDYPFAHVEGFDTCTTCHDPHSLEVRVDVCSTCHEGVVSKEDLKNIRSVGSASDYDGDGDVTESIGDEIAGLQSILYAAIRAYAAAAGTPIVYDSHSHPYFFIDSNGNGQADEGEARYNAFTPRLLKATYNLQVSIKDLGAFAHNGKYIIQMLYDSIEDLDSSLVVGLHRDDAGHFAGSGEAFRHWDDDGEVRGSCSKCHSATGLPFFLKEGVTVSEPLANGLMCSTCHDSQPEYTLYTVDEVEFPSGAAVSFGEGDSSNLCLNCHQGRESTVSVDEDLAGLGPDEGSVRLHQVHYYPAGATLFGTEVKGAYEYEGKVYNGRFGHVGSFDTCTECHDSHNLEVKMQACGMCHSGIGGSEDIRSGTTDFDGDGNTAEGIAGEIETLHGALYAAIQNYVNTVHGVQIAYPGSGSYFYEDTNGNGVIDDDENTRYRNLNARLYRAYYNFIYVVKDPGAFAHNGKYVIQVLYDSLEDLGADTTGMVRP